MFIEFTSGDRECFLLRSCDANSTYSCSSEPDCLMAVSGPATPSLVESCCEGFAEVACENEDQNEVGHEFDVPSEQACQQMCRDIKDCAYWTLSGTDCFFFRDCRSPEVHFYTSNERDFICSPGLQSMYQWCSLPRLEHLWITSGGLLKLFTRHTFIFCSFTTLRVFFLIV